MNVDCADQSRRRRANNQLGVSAVLWERIWDPQARFRIKLGPLKYQQFQDFLPTGEAYRHLVELTRFFVGEEFSFEVQPVLRADEVPVVRARRRTPPCAWAGACGSRPNRSPHRRRNPCSPRACRCGGRAPQPDAGTQPIMHNLKSLIGRLNETTRRSLEGAAGLCLVAHELRGGRRARAAEAGRDAQLRPAPDLRATSAWTRRGSHASSPSAIDRFKTGNARTPAFSPRLPQADRRGLAARVDRLRRARDAVRAPAAGRSDERGAGGPGEAELARAGR